MARTRQDKTDNKTDNVRIKERTRKCREDKLILKQRFGEKSRRQDSMNV